VLAEVASLLGGSASIPLSSHTVESLQRLTHRQLVDSSRLLGLTGVSRLNKEALARRLLEALERTGARTDAVGGGGAGGAAIAPPVAADGTGAAGGTATDEAARQPWSHKFEVGERATGPIEEPREIPWGYGRDRVTAMAVDPDRLFAYWEVLDESMARARAQLGPAGTDAWLSLRIYDTTGRLFDGTNAHSYFDHRVERSDRQYFFHIGKPTSEAFVEIGLKSAEGYFAKIARSGRLEFPRREPAPWSDPEWLTVRIATGHVERAGSRTPARSTGAGASGPAPSFEAAPTWALRRVPWEDVARSGPEEGGEQRIEWEELLTDGTFEGHRSFAWEGPATITSWEAGPFTYPVEVPEPVRESFVGKTRVYRVGGRTHVVYGPWQVVIRGMGGHQGRAVVSRWEVYRSWVSNVGGEVRGTVVGGAHAGASERLTIGASERRWIGGSEVRFGGASEIYYLGASEVRFAGASETLFAGASQWMLKGASEWQYLGASEIRLRGASELAMRGASEQRFQGASERRIAGGGSEGRLGASENLGAGAVEGAAPDGAAAPAPPPPPSPYPEAPRGPRPTSNG
jgi:hypothetical protein